MPKSLPRPNGAPGRAAVRDRRARASTAPAHARDARPHALAQLHTLDRETFGKRLRSARKRFGWTLAETAERSGISITTISRAERGQLALSYEKFSALGRALRMDMGALFAEAGGEAQDFQGPIVTRAGQGVTNDWALEFVGPVRLIKVGWSAKTFVPGEIVSAKGHPSRAEGTVGLSPLSVSRADGQVIPGSGRGGSFAPEAGQR